MSERVRFICASNAAGDHVRQCEIFAQYRARHRGCKKANEQPVRETLFMCAGCQQHDDDGSVLKLLRHGKREDQQSLVYGVCPEVTQWQLSVFCFAELHQVCHCRCSLFIGSTDVKNIVCLLLKFCPPGIL